MEQFLIEYCSPTLAGLKTANLCNCPAHSLEELNMHLCRINNLLNKKDVYLEVLNSKNGRALIYVYRKSKITQELTNQNILDFLRAYGYNCGSFTYCIERLKKRFACSDIFPHEIGVFLGYPLKDVIGFIENEGKNSKCSGLWKVYSDEYKAMQLFERYNKCRKVYMKLFAGGRSIMQLTVAA